MDSEGNSAQRIVETIDKLPSLPTVMTQIFQTVSDPDASALDLARLITIDQSLSASVLHLVNSAYYGFSRKISDITEAIVVLGFVKVRDLALTATTFSSFGPVESEIRSRLWTHSVATAMTCERLARNSRLPANAGFFSTGLLHDIGKVVLSTAFTTEYDALLNEPDKTKQLWELEQERFNTTHTEVGFQLAEKWALPENIKYVIQAHHNTEEEDLKNADIVLPVTQLSNYIVHLAGLASNEHDVPPSYPTAAGKVLSLDEEECMKQAEDIKNLRSSIENFLGILND